MAEPLRKPVHRHRRARKADFVGKTIARVDIRADNVWKLFFTDGTAFAIQAEYRGGIAYMELCEACAAT